MIMMMTSNATRSIFGGLPRLRLVPLSADHNFDDGIFAVLLLFSSRASKFRHSLTKELQHFVRRPWGFARGLHPRLPIYAPSPILNTKYATERNCAHSRDMNVKRRPPIRRYTCTPKLAPSADAYYENFYAKFM